jgi:SAM-dependent methyltransferase
MQQSSDDLRAVYRERFSQSQEYRNRVWKILATEFFQRWIVPDAVVLDLGCGYGQFINNIVAGRRLAMDLNPDSRLHLRDSVEFLHHDSALPWPIGDETLDVVFTSNFLEHLPSKQHVQLTVREARRCLKPGGTFIAIGPNIRYLPGAYWDFFDHHTPLSDRSLAELMRLEKLTVKTVVPRFLPYTLIGSPEYPIFLLRIYLSAKCLWWIKGRQFLVIACRPPC